MSMRIIWFVLAIFLSAASGHAKWKHLPKLDLIACADAIVIAEYSGYRSVPAVGSFYDQLGFFTATQCLKGKLDLSFSVYGTSQQICAPLIYFKSLKPGRYLMFLSKREFGWTDCNAAVLEIEDGKVLWFKDDVKADKSLQKIEGVIEDIRKNLK